METTASIPEPPAAEPESPTTSLSAKLLNIIAAPAEVFNEIKTAPNRSVNWLVPTLIYVVIGVISVCMLFRQPAIQQTIHDQQVKALDQQVQKGKMTQAQEDQTLQAMDRFMGPTVLAIAGSVSIIFYGFASLFWWALVLWLAGRWFFKARFDYLKAVEVAGLTSVILVLAVITGTLLAVILGRLYVGPNLALLVSEFDPANRLHLMLGAANVLYFWHTAILGVGLASVSGASTARSVGIVFAYWLAAESLLIAIGLGQWTL